MEMFKTFFIFCQNILLHFIKKNMHFLKTENSGPLNFFYSFKTLFFYSFKTIFFILLKTLVIVINRDIEETIR